MLITERIEQREAELESLRSQLADLELHGNYPGHVQPLDGPTRYYQPLPKPELDAERERLKSRIAETLAEIAGLKEARKQKLSRLENRPGAERTAAEFARRRALAAEDPLSLSTLTPRLVKIAEVFLDELRNGTVWVSEDEIMRRLETPDSKFRDSFRRGNKKLQGSLFVRHQSVPATWRLNLPLPTSEAEPRDQNTHLTHP